MISKYLESDRPPTADFTSDTTVDLLAYAHVDQDHVRAGIGSRILEHILENYLDPKSEAVYAEEWLYDESKDARQLLQSFNFKMVYTARDYWGKEFCEYHGKEETECVCDGAIYRRSIDDNAVS